MEPQQGTEIPTKEEDIHQDTKPDLSSPILSLLPLSFIEMATTSVGLIWSVLSHLTHS